MGRQLKRWEALAAFVDLRSGVSIAKLTQIWGVSEAVLRRAILRVESQQSRSDGPLARHMVAREDDGYEPTRMPAHPTSARPGSRQKVEVLICRAESCEELWHPDDFVVSKVFFRKTLDLSERSTICRDEATEAG